MTLLYVIPVKSTVLINVLTLLNCLFVYYLTTTFFLQRLSNLLLKFLAECMSAVAIL